MHGRDRGEKSRFFFKMLARWRRVGEALRLAGGDLGDRAKQQSALSRTLTRALNITVATVVAG